jgi:trehalose 6-phosphate phosphatase
LALMDIAEDCTEAKIEPAPNPLQLADFLHSIAAASESALLLDFDGTLAPFRIDPSTVRPWAGVKKLLDEIQQTKRTRLAIISGRPARDVASQLGMHNAPEIWGLHGAERLLPNGMLEKEKLSPDQQEVIDAARAAIHETRLTWRLEEKPNAVVVHWRGKHAHVAQSLRRRALDLMQAFADNAGVRLLEFDGGIELRAGHDKGDAVHRILEEMPPDTPAAYLGDDITDEDAFQALTGKGLSVLVRREWRPSSAQLWLRPPVQLREFLRSWLQAVQL